MFINDRIIYLHMQKTGGTHISKLLKSHLDGEVTLKHGQLRGSPGDRLVFGSVRNPWDWYVSIWTYGCQGDGIVPGRLKMPFPQIGYLFIRESLFHPEKWVQAAKKIPLHARKDHTYWQRLFSCVDDPQLFREWLRSILSASGKVLLTAEYPHVPMRHVAGYMTFEFLRLFLEFKHWPRLSRSISSMTDINEAYERHGIGNRFIRIESLERDVAEILNELEVAIDQTDLKGARTNASRRHPSASYYYDDETIELVRNEERFLIERFGYEPPIVTSDAAGPANGKSSKIMAAPASTGQSQTQG